VVTQTEKRGPGPKRKTRKEYVEKSTKKKKPGSKTSAREKAGPKMEVGTLVEERQLITRRKGIENPTRQTVFLNSLKRKWEKTRKAEKKNSV